MFIAKETPAMPAKKRKTTKKRTTTKKAAPKRKTTTKRKTTAKRKTAKKTTRKSPAKKRTTAKKKPARKTAAKKRTTTKKKTTARKSTAKKASSIRVMQSAPSVREPFTKTELNRTISDMTGLATKDVKGVLEALEMIIHEHVKSRGPQVFTLPGLAKIKVVRKKATKARKGVNPFTGEPCTFKAKPARNVVKVQALKKLKEMAK